MSQTPSPSPSKTPAAKRRHMVDSSPDMDLSLSESTRKKHMTETPQSAPMDAQTRDVVKKAMAARFPEGIILMGHDSDVSPLRPSALDLEIPPGQPHPVEEPLKAQADTTHESQPAEADRAQPKAKATPKAKAKGRAKAACKSKATVKSSSKPDKIHSSKQKKEAKSVSKPGPFSKQTTLCFKISVTPGGAATATAEVRPI